MNIVKVCGKGTWADPIYYRDVDDSLYIKGQEYINRIKRIWKQKYNKDVDWGCYQNSIAYTGRLGIVNKRGTEFEKSKSSYIPKEIIDAIEIENDDLFMEKVEDFEAEMSAWT